MFRTKPDTLSGEPKITVIADTLLHRIAQVREQIAAACARAQRSPDSVTLIAVSKTHPPTAVIEAAQLGLLHFGENRIEEASAKIAQVNTQMNTQVTQTLTWHMIGHVQSRKAEDVIATFDVIPSLDSVKLAERYSRFAEAHHKPVRVLLEVNVSGEASKGGFQAAGWQANSSVRAALWEAVGKLVLLPAVEVIGLMTMAPIVDDMEQVRPVFASLRTLRDALAAEFPASAWAHLSMGMTDDYPVAIEEGATLVRIGRALFGDRTY
jgi:PLP dependent protein